MNVPRCFGLFVSIFLLANVFLAPVAFAAGPLNLLGLLLSQARISNLDAAKLSPAEVQAAVDSLLVDVSRARNLKVMSEVEARVANREQVLQRLGEIAREDGVEERLASQARILKHLGLVPADLDIYELWKKVIATQLTGFYDVNRRNLNVAEWLSPELQTLVTIREVAHALQDQHFSLRVRKRLGFETYDERVAWNSFVEGDATAVLLTMNGHQDLSKYLQEAETKGFTGLPGMNAEDPIFSQVPPIVRDYFLFPYIQGIRFVAELLDRGGWQLVDDAYIQVPSSTEQILHPQRYVSTPRDEPIRVELPDLRGMLRAGHRPVFNDRIGEFAIYSYLSQYIDPEIAKVASEGWGGVSAILYGDSPEAPDALTLTSIWDSEDDAVEFFGTMIGVLDARFPDQEGWSEETNAERIVWKLDEDARFVNVIHLSSRSVICLENIPGGIYQRVLKRLQRATHFSDPTPGVRAIRKDDLPWGRRGRAAELAKTIDVELPANWTAVDSSLAPGVILEARRGGAKLTIAADPSATDPMGLDGYTHQLAFEQQRKGSNTYVHIDVDHPRRDQEIYQHIFSQLENGQQVVYYIGGVALGGGYGYVMIEQPNDGSTPNLENDFQQILGTLNVVTVANALGLDTGNGVRAQGDR